MNVSIQEFVDSCTRFIMLEMMEDEGTFFYAPYLVLKKKADGECLFLREGRCSIHDFKPFQCSTTPFMAEFFEHDEWRNEIRQRCHALKVMKDEDFLPYHEQYGIAAEEREREYFRMLRDHNFSLESLLNVTLPAPDIETCE